MGFYWLWWQHGRKCDYVRRLLQTDLDSDGGNSITVSSLSFDILPPPPDRVRASFMFSRQDWNCGWFRAVHGINRVRFASYSI